MSAIKTHYDNLQVARNANPVVIAAAYRSLSLKYHPDRNAGDPRCEEIMRIINRSYAVLSDAAQRSAHDIWITAMETQAASVTQSGPQASSKEPTHASDGQRATAEPAPVRSGHPASTGFYYIIERLVPFAWPLLFAAGIALLFALDIPTSRPSGLPPYDRSPATDVPTAPPAYERPATAPNGSPWPVVPGYLEGEPFLGGGGLSTVKVDNRDNSSDVFVKLVLIDASATKPVRQFFIPGHGEFTVEDLKPGEYDVRYKDLTDGSLARSESFSLKQIREPGGTSFSNITMTLYKVSNGNMQTYPLLDSEF